jgi:hypothetical protein
MYSSAIALLRKQAAYALFGLKAKSVPGVNRAFCLEYAEMSNALRVVEETFPPRLTEQITIY